MSLLLTSQSRWLILIATCCSLASHCFQHVWWGALSVSHHKRSYKNHFSRLGAKGSPITTFNPLKLRDIFIQTRILLLSLSGSWWRATKTSRIKVYQQCLEEWTEWGAQEGASNNTNSALKLAELLVHLFRVALAWYTIGICHSGISAFWNNIITIRLQMILLSLTSCIAFFAASCYL